MIEVTDLKKSFGVTHALRGVNLKVSPGRITGLLGPNACGKTTLIKSILGLVIPDSGVVRVAGELTSRDGRYRQIIGYLPQNPDFPANLTIDELLAMMEDIRQKPANRKQELIDLFELRAFTRRPFGVLSGGTKQKVGAVLAFMFNPEILILDEPTVGLDPVAVVRIKDLMKKAATDGKTVFLVSHIMSEIEQLVSELAFLLDGGIVYSGTLENILTRTPNRRLEDSIVQLIAQSRS